MCFRGGGTSSLAPAFTLAEVLVTLGIIGVVSAMTLPTLVKNHQRQVYVTQLQKVYNELSQAFEQIITDSNAVNLRESKLEHDGVENFFRNYFKTVNVCNTSPHECFADEYKNINGTVLRTRSILGSNNEVIAVTLASGASVWMRQTGPGNYYVYTDVNGKSGPNILGRDLFDFTINNDGQIEVCDYCSNFNSDCASATDDTYGGCLAKIMEDGWKMDY